jgi:hypothetical protein
MADHILMIVVVVVMMIQYLEMSINYEAPHFAITSTLFSLDPSYVNNFVTSLFSNSLSQCSSHNLTIQLSHP